MSRDSIVNEYFEWICFMVCGGEAASDGKSYRKLLTYLHSSEFRYSITNDGNRAEDGIDLRYRFAMESGYDHIENSIFGPCSVLEMMAALAIRCEEHIMDDPEIGDRTNTWFWSMVRNLGLETMTDDRFDKSYTKERISIFLDRRYSRDGKGGLFTIKHSESNMRATEIWYQMCWYLDSILQNGYEERRMEMR